MNQKELLAICSSCINRKLDFEMGFVCGLTNSFADYNKTCNHYEMDETVTDTISVRVKERPFVPLFDPLDSPAEVKKKNKISKKKKPSKVALKKLRRYQSFPYALIGGLLFMTVSSVGWVFITVTTGYEGVYMALGVGLLVGIAIRYFGAGINRIFGILAALLTLVGSLLGYYLTLTDFLEEAQLTRIVTLPDYLSPDLMLNSIRENFVPFDLLFYGLSALLGYLLAIRRVNKKKMIKLESDGYKGAPALYWLRLPLILAGILLPTYFGYTLTSQDSGGYSTFYYESGTKMSEGEMHKGLETGQWTSWHENGNLKSIGNYIDGISDSLWKWYDESGILTGTGTYLHGVKKGTWMHYYPNGVVSDSGAYLGGLKEGLWKYYHENGHLKFAIHYKAGKMHGEKILFSPLGNVVKIDYLENGVMIEK